MDDWFLEGIHPQLPIIYESMISTFDSLLANETMLKENKVTTYGDRQTVNYFQKLLDIKCAIDYIVLQLGGEVQ